MEGRPEQSQAAHSEHPGTCDSSHGECSNPDPRVPSPVNDVYPTSDPEDGEITLDLESVMEQDLREHGVSPEIDTTSRITALERQLQTTEQKLCNTTAELEATRSKLCKAERLYEKVNKYNDDLRKQVDSLSEELHQHKQQLRQNILNRVEASTQFDPALVFTDQSDVHQNTQEPYAVESVNTCTTTMASSSDTPTPVGDWDSTPGQDPSTSAAVSQEDTGSQSLADSLRATAEQAIQQQGFVFDERTGLYYDYSSGYYYNAERGLYYEPNSGTYYYYDQHSQSYQFHSQVDVSEFNTQYNQTTAPTDTPATHSDTKKKKKKRTKPEEEPEDEQNRKKRKAKEDKESRQKHKSKAQSHKDDHGHRRSSSKESHREHHRKGRSKENSCHRNQGDTSSKDNSRHGNKRCTSSKDNSCRGNHRDSSSKDPCCHGNHRTTSSKDDSCHGNHRTTHLKEHRHEERRRKSKKRQKDHDEEVTQDKHSHHKKKKRHKRHDDSPKTCGHRRRKAGRIDHKDESDMAESEHGSDIEVIELSDMDDGSVVNGQTDGQILKSPSLADSAEIPDHEDEQGTNSGGNVMENSDGERQLVEKQESEQESELESGLEEGEISEDSSLSSSSESESESGEGSEFSVDAEDSVGVGEEQMEEHAAFYPPCIRLMVTSSQHVDVGSLFIVTCTGATIGREEQLGHGVVLPDEQVSKMHCDIRYDEAEKYYMIKDYASQNGTYVNNKRLSEPKVISDPHPIRNGDTVQIGSTSLGIHIHPGTETCDECEPGLVQAKIQAERGPTKEVVVMSKAEKERQRRKNLKQIKKKFGLADAAYVDDSKVMNNPNYKDKAGERRRTVGSDNPYQKDDAPSSVDRALSTENKGHKLLAKMGWKEGDSLGKSQPGIKEPIQVRMRSKQSAGLGSGMSYERSLDDAGQPSGADRWIKAQDRFHKTLNTTAPKKHGHMTWVQGQTVDQSGDRDSVQEETVETEERTVQTPCGEED